jgi:hypothetical protein
MSWHDYVGVLPSTAAILNGFIAVLVAQFFKDHPIAKICLVVAAGILGVLAIVATVYGQHQIIAQREVEIAQSEANIRHKKEIRENIGLFIASVNTLAATTADKSKEIPLTEIGKLENDLTTYIKNNMEQSYLNRLFDSSGVGPIGINSGDKERDKWWYTLYVFAFRLEEFSRQFGD